MRSVSRKPYTYLELSVSKAFGQKITDIWTSVDGLLTNLEHILMEEQMPDSVPHEAKRLHCKVLTASNSLARLSSEYSRTRKFRQTALNIILSVSLIALYLATFSFDLFGGLTARDITPTWPRRAYDIDPERRTVFSLSDMWKDDLAREFNLHYFNHDSRFLELLFHDGSPQIGWRVLIENSSTRKAEFISEVEYSAKLKKEIGFPWEALRYNSDIISVTREISSGFVEALICNRGVGPAHDLKCETTFESEVVERSETPIIWGNNGGEQGDCFVAFSTFLPGENVDWIETSNGRLSKTLYKKLQGEELTRRPRSFRWRDEAFVEIDTVLELQKETTVFYGNDWLTRCRFETVDGKKEAVEISGKLGLQYVWYKNMDGSIVSYDPRTLSIKPPPEHYDSVISEQARIMPDPWQYSRGHNPLGKDVIRMEADLDATMLKEGEQELGYENIGEFLNANGILMINGAVSIVTSGVYEIEISVNKKTIALFAQEILVPEEYKYCTAARGDFLRRLRGKWVSEMNPTAVRDRCVNDEIDSHFEVLIE